MASYAGFRSSSPVASEVGRRNRRFNTAPEIRLEAALRQLGLRFTVNARDITGRPDIAFRALKLAVFCDGDFWHGRNWRKRRRALANGSNPSYWIPKILGNIRRDRTVTRDLAKDGWLVMRFWGSDVILNPSAIALQVAIQLRARTHEYSGNHRR